MVGPSSRPEQAWRLAEFGLRRSPLAQRRVGPQRAPRRPASKWRLEGGTVLSERVLIDGVGAARPVAEIDIQPLRREPAQRIDDHVLVRKKRLRQLIKLGVAEQPARFDR